MYILPPKKKSNKSENIKKIRSHLITKYQCSKVLFLFPFSFPFRPSREPVPPLTHTRDGQEVAPNVWFPFQFHLSLSLLWFLTDSFSCAIFAQISLSLVRDASSPPHLCWPGKHDPQYNTIILFLATTTPRFLLTQLVLPPSPTHPVFFFTPSKHWKGNGRSNSLSFLRLISTEGSPRETLLLVILALGEPWGWRSSVTRREVLEKCLLSARPRARLLTLLYHVFFTLSLSLKERKTCWISLFFSETSTTSLLDEEGC